MIMHTRTSPVPRLPSLFNAHIQYWNAEGEPGNEVMHVHGLVLGLLFT